MAQDQFDSLPTFRARTTVYNPNEDKWGYQTATGVRSREGYTVAVDPSVIPYGRYIQLLNEDGTPWNDPNGNFGIRKAVDTGSAVKSRKASGGNEPVIDLFFEGDVMENQKKIGNYAKYRILPEDYVPNFEEDKNIKKAEPVEQPNNQRPFFGNFEFEDVIADEEFLSLPAKNKLTAYNAWLRDYELVAKDNIPTYTPEKFLEYKKSLSEKIQPILKDKEDKILLDKKPYDFGLKGERKIDQFRIKDAGKKDISRTLDIAESVGDLTPEERDELQSKIEAESLNDAQVNALNIGKYFLKEGRVNDLQEGFDQAFSLYKSKKPEDQESFQDLARALSEGTGEGVGGAKALGNAFARGSLGVGTSVLGLSEMVTGGNLSKNIASIKEDLEKKSEKIPSSLPMSEADGALETAGLGALKVGEAVTEVIPSLSVSGATALRAAKIASKAGKGVQSISKIANTTAGVTSGLLGAGEAYQGEGNTLGATVTGAVTGAIDAKLGLPSSFINGSVKGLEGSISKSILENGDELLKQGAEIAAKKAPTYLLTESAKNTGKEIVQEVSQELAFIQNERQNAGLGFGLDAQDASRLKDTAVQTALGIAPISVGTTAMSRKINADLTRRVESMNQAAKEFTTARSQLIDSGMTPEEADKIVADTSNLDKLFADLSIVDPKERQQLVEELSRKEGISFQEATNAYVAKKEQETKAIEAEQKRIIDEPENQRNVAIAQIEATWKSLIASSNLKKEALQKEIVGQTDPIKIGSLTAELEQTDKNIKDFTNQLNSKKYIKNAEAISQRINQVNQDHFKRVNESKDTIKKYFNKLGINPDNVSIVNSVESVLIRAAQDPKRFSPEQITQLADLQTKTEGFTNFSNVTPQDFDSLMGSNDLNVWNPAFTIGDKVYIVADPKRLNQTAQVLRSLYAHEKAHVYLNGVKANMSPESWRVFLDKINANMTDQNTDLTAFDKWLQKEKGIDGRIGLAEEYSKLQNNPNISKEDMVTEELLTNYIEFVTAEEDARNTGLFSKMRDVTDNIATVVGLRSQQLMSVFNENPNLIKAAVQQAPDIAIMNWVDNSYSNEEINKNKPINDLKDIILNDSLKSGLELQKKDQKRVVQESDLVQEPVTEAQTETPPQLVIQESIPNLQFEDQEYRDSLKNELINFIKETEAKTFNPVRKEGLKIDPLTFTQRAELKKAKDELDALNRYEAMKAMDEVLFSNDPQGMTREEFMVQRLQDRTKAYELLTGRAFGSVQYALPFYGDQMVIDNGKFQYVDYLGGFAYGRVTPDGVANISIMSAVPAKFLNTPAQDQFKGRGFFRTLIRRFLKNGVTKVEMPFQTEDTIKTVQGLLNKGELINPAKPVLNGGVNIPTQFDINNQIQYALPSNYQESFDDAMLDNYAGALSDLKALMDEHPERGAEIMKELVEETTGQPIQYALPSIRGDIVSNLPSLMQNMITDFGYINNAEMRDKTNLSFLALAREKKAASMEALQLVQDLKGIGIRGKVLMNKIGWKNKNGGTNTFTRTKNGVVVESNIDISSPDNIQKQKDITIALAGEPTIGQLSVEEQNLVKEMRDLLKEKSALMVANGMMTESDAREIDLLGGYVPRYYNKYQTAPFASGKASLFKKRGNREIGSLTRGWTIIDGDEYVSVWSTEAKARAELKRLQALPDNKNAKLRYQEPTSTRDLIEIAGEEQIEFNPAVWFPMYMAEINVDIAKHKFIQQFADSLKLEGKLLTKEEVDKLPLLDQEEYTIVSGDQSGDNFGVKKYGDLAGMYIPVRAHEFITRTFENSRKEFWETWKGIADLWAVGKTAFSPSTFMANIASTVINSFTLGVTPFNPNDFGYFGQALDLAWEAGMKGEISPKIIELVRAGVISRASMNGELINELDLTRKNLQQAVVEKKPFNLLTAFSEAFDIGYQSVRKGRPTIALKAIRESYPVQKVMAFYGLVDDVIKIAAYLKRLKQGDTKEQASAFIHRYGINYDTVPQNSTVTAWKYGVNRFYSFTHQFGGLMANLTEDTFKKSPLTGKKEFDKLGTMILLTALPMFLHQIGMGLSDESDESKEDIEAKMAQDSLINKFEFIPENIRKPLALFGSGRAYVDPMLEQSGVKDLLGLEKNYLMKFTRYLPSLDLFGSRFSDAVVRGQDGTASSIARSLMTGSPIVKSFYQMAANVNSYSGVPIVAKGTPELEAARQQAEMVALEFAPTILTSLYMNQNAGKLGSVNQKREVPVTWLKTMGGIDLEMADPTDYEIAAMSRKRRGLPEEVQGKYIETYQDRLTKQLVLAIKNGDFETASELRKKIQELGIDAEGNPLTGKALKDYVFTNSELKKKLKNMTPLRFAGQSTKDRNALKRDIEQRSGISKRSLDKSMEIYQQARKNVPAFQAYERSNP